MQLTAANGRVGMWRGGGRIGLSVSAPFAWRCLNSRAISPFPHPAHRTGRALLTHPALGQGITPSHTEGHEQPSDQPPGPRSLVRVTPVCQTACRALGTSGLYQLNCTHTIAFPVSSAGGEAQAMAAHRQAFPTPRGDGKSDPKGDAARLPDVVARRLWCTHTTARRAPSRKPRNAVVCVQFS